MKGHYFSNKFIWKMEYLKCYVSLKPLEKINDDFMSKQDGCEEIVNIWKILLTDLELDIICSSIAKKLNEKFRTHNKSIVIVGILKGV